MQLMTERFDDDRLGARIKRFTQVGTSVGGLAAQLAANRLLGTKLDGDKHSAELRAKLGDLKGPLMKAAQMLAHIPDALPKEYADELRELQSNAPPMGWSFVKRRMKGELGPQWQEHFQDFPKEAVAAASLGQVHKATLNNGEVVAAKLQYPDMASAVESDMQQLKMAFGIFSIADNSIDVSNVYSEIGARLREELDYKREARHLRLFGHLLQDEPNTHLPFIYDQVSTDRLLTMEWLEGQSLVDFLATNPSQEERNQVARNIFRAWYIPFYSCGVIHADPHMGNYSVRDDLSINLLDFGCVRLFSARFIGGVIDLYLAVKNDDADLAAKAYAAWNFENVTPELVEVLNLWASFIMAPILADSAGSLAATNSGAMGIKVAQQATRELKRLGGIKLPAEFVFMDRAAVGIGSVLLRLDAKVNWAEEFQELIADFDVDTMAQRQKELFAEYDLPDPNVAEAK